MITKVLQSNDLRATLDYVYQEGKAPEVIDSTCPDDSKDGALESIREFIEQRPEIKKPVFHAVLSLSEEEAIDKNTWKQIAETYAKKMGYGEVPYVAVKHHDTAHHHIHIVASRVTLDGELIRDSFEAYRSQEVARELERTHKLTPVPSSWEVDQRRERPEDLHRAERLQIPSQRERMRVAIAESLQRAHDVPSFVQALEHRSVRAIPNTTQDQSKVQGISFERDGVKLSGSKIDRQYSWNRLKHTLDYAHERDLNTLQRPPEVRAPGLTQREASPAPDLRSSSTVLRAQPEPVKAHTPPENLHTHQAKDVHTPGKEARERVAANVMRRALDEAPYKEGWKSWKEALARHDVEVIPKGTQEHPARVRGIYFAHEGTQLPGSTIDRKYSVAALQERLGVLKEEEVYRTFERVHIPGKGLTALTPDAHKLHHTSPPQEDTLSPLVSRLKQAQYRIEVDPARFQGHWQGVVHNVRGERFAVLSAHPTSETEAPRHAALVRLPEELKLDVSSYTRDAPLMLSRMQDGRLHLTQHEPRPEVAAPRASSYQDTLTPLMQRLEQARYHVVHEPEHFKGTWQGVVQDAQGTGYAVLKRETARGQEAALFKLDAQARFLEAERDAQGKLHMTATHTSHDFLHKEDTLHVRRDAQQVLFLRQQEREHVRQEQGRAEPVLSKQAWLERAHKAGLETRELGSFDGTTGRLQERVVTLKEGRYHVVECDAKRRVLVPYHEKLESHAGHRVVLQTGQRATSLSVHRLDRERDLDR